MRKLLTAFVLLIVVVLTPADAGAKGVATLVVVGSGGRSNGIEPEGAVLAVMLYHPGSVYNHRPERAAPRGGYVKIYPLGPAGFPAMPGRFYPATRALCFGWGQAAAPRSCGRLGPPRRLLAASRWDPSPYGEDDEKQKTIKRLKTILETTDGFKIAEIDLELRGPGDFFGTRQAGVPTRTASAGARNLSSTSWVLPAP